LREKYSYYDYDDATLSISGGDMRRIRSIAPALLAAAALWVGALGENSAQNPPTPNPLSNAGPATQGIGLIRNEPGAFQGYTLVSPPVSPLQSQTTFLIDMNGIVVKSWATDSAPSSLAYLQENGNMLRASDSPGVDKKPIESCSGLSLHLQGKTTRVEKGGALQLSVEIQNNGSAPRWIYGNLAPGVWLHLFDASGKEVQPRVLYEHAPIPPEKADFNLIN
jgi:hypothetical protein